MAVTYEGHVENGQIKLDENVKLPEKAKVYVVIPEASGTRTLRIMSPRFANPADAADFKKVVVECPEDA